jgi:hypothetical protein
MGRLPSPAAYLFGAPSVDRCGPYVQQSRPLLTEGGGRFRVRSIEYPASVLRITPGLDQPGLTQDRKMVGYKALREVQHVLDLADAQLLPGEQNEDAQTGLVCQRLEGNEKLSRPWRSGFKRATNNHDSTKGRTYQPSLI